LSTNHKKQHQLVQDIFTHSTFNRHFPAEPGLALMNFTFTSPHVLFTVQTTSIYHS